MHLHIPLYGNKDPSAKLSSASKTAVGLQDAPLSILIGHIILTTDTVEEPIHTCSQPTRQNSTRPSVVDFAFLGLELHRIEGNRRRKTAGAYEDRGIGAESTADKAYVWLV